MVALNREFLAQINGPFMETWNAIAPDAAPACEGDNECAIEMVIDADRMTMYGGAEGKVADDLIGQAVKEHGYQKVLAFLSNQFSLV